MRSLTFDELFAMLSAVSLSTADLARLRAWIASVAHPAECGPVTAAQLATRLLPVLAPDALLISDAAAAYRRFCADAGITHEAVNVQAGIRARGAIHIQNVNAWHSRFKSRLVRFRGVASRYLAHYSGWQRVLDARLLATPAQLLCAAAQLDECDQGRVT